MILTRRNFAGAAAATTLLPRIGRAQAQTLRIGVLNDESGPYRDDGGPTSAICTRQAIAEFGNKGFAVDVLVADHQNKPDVGAGIARRWFDQEGVDAIVDVPTSSVALAVNNVCREKNRVMLNNGAATTDLTGAQCSPNTVHWTYDTYMLARSTGGAMVRAGGDTWFFITADYVFGHQLERDTTRFIQAAGGKVLGSASYPFPDTSDFSNLLVQAQASGAKVLGLANSGNDTINCIKQAREFGLMRTMKVAAMLMYNSNVHALGLEAAQGLLLTESYYWDLNDRTRAFNERVKPKTPNQWPNMVQAGCYASTLHYLKAVADVGIGTAKTEWGCRRGPHEGDADGRRLLWCGENPGGRAQDPPVLFVPGQVTSGKQAAVGRAEAGCDHPSG